MIKLVGTDGQRFYSFDLKTGKYIIGRKDYCDLTVPHKTISRKHAEIEVDHDGNKISLNDLGSHNGTFVNDVRIDTKTLIGIGDSIKFGQTDFKLSDEKDADIAPSKSDSILTDDNCQESVLISINEVLKPLPPKMAEIPEMVSTISKMAKMLVLNEPEERLLEHSLKLIARIIPCERLAVLYASDDQQDIEIASTLLPGGKDLGAFNLSRTIVNEVIANKNAVLICNPEEDPRFAAQESIIMSNLKSAMAVPLFDEGKVLGILYADTMNPSQRYDDEHIRILAIFSNIIASRLTNLSLLSEREEKRIIESELERAAEIQKSLLVTTSPKINGLEITAFQEQSRSVGGDLYDMTILPDGKLLFLVADVSGKGTGAALLMSNILASFRILYESPNFDLVKIVKRVSLQVFSHTDPGVFATLFVGLVDAESGIIKYINAGHNPPLLIKKEGTLEHLEPSGVMIGAFDFVDWTEDTITVSVGDQLMIFSDGVTEADSDAGQYGDERLEKLVLEVGDKSPSELIKYIMDDINLFVGNFPQSDDITIMVLKRTES